MSSENFSVIKTVLDNDFATLKTYVDQKIVDGINAKVAAKKVDILAAMNGVSPEKMSELMAVA